MYDSRENAFLERSLGHEKKFNKRIPDEVWCFYADSTDNALDKWPIVSD